MPGLREAGDPVTAVAAPGFRIDCNGCDEPLEDEDGFILHFREISEAADAASAAEWTFDAQTGDAWCPNCQDPANDGEAGAEPVDACRPVTVEVDGEQITTMVRAAEEMSEEGRAAFADLLGAAKRRHTSGLLEAARERDRDVRAVRDIIAAVERYWCGLDDGDDLVAVHAALGVRFSERIDQLDARDAAKAAIQSDRSHS